MEERMLIQEIRMKAATHDTDEKKYVEKDWMASPTGARVGDAHHSTKGKASADRR